ncbi:PIG-L family deacetylase [Xylanimonas oleitrophica]|uniref:PIG-L family deacetylase n=1 Tax=Xylanimonas oleitrophica TaxID=2607479 RepID=UPI001FEC28D4|nr:PIG-L family deacetylase [Xylanimonas oleitrophica]
MSPAPSRVVPAGGLVAVHAHPDDETLSTGGLIATWAAAGLPVTVVTCTRGERGEVIALPGTTSEGLAHLEGDGVALAAHREAELATALLALGGGEAGAVGHRFLDQVDVPGTAQPAASGRPGARYEDSGMAWVAPGVAGPDPEARAGFATVPIDDAALRLAALLRRLRPAVVATYERGGGYGHPDHVRAHAVTVRALHLAASDDAALPGSPWRPQLWQAVAAAGELRAARSALAAAADVRGAAARAGLTFPADDDPLPALARDDAALGDLPPGALATVPLGPVLDRVVGALRAHATQVQHVTVPTAPSAHLAGAGVLGWYALSNAVVAPLRAHERYLVTAGAADAQAASVGSAG